MTEFPAYVKGKSCIQLGGKHVWVNKLTCRRCRLCGSSQTFKAKPP